MIEVALCVGVVGLFLSWLVARQSKKSGRAEAERDTAAERLDDVQTANKARDRVIRDPDYARRVRDKYRRK